MQSRRPRCPDFSRGRRRLYRFDPGNVAGRVGGLGQQAHAEDRVATAYSTIILFFASTAICAL
jgi:hypothetical protein